MNSLLLRSFETGALGLLALGSPSTPAASERLGPAEAVRIAAPGDEHWWDGIGPYGQGGLPYEVRALAEYQGALHAGGNFYDSGRDIFNIARWDGSQWQSLEQGLFWHAPPCDPSCASSVRALVVYNGNLVAGGRFYFAGLEHFTRRANNVARWDGTRWYKLDSGVNDNVYALAVYRDELIVGGVFTQVGAQYIAWIARWNGNEWRALGAGLNGAVTSMVEYDGDLIVAGGFTRAGDQTVHRIARWDGTAWSPLGNLDLEQIPQIGLHRDTLVAHVDHDPGPGENLFMSRWNGASWDSIPGGDRMYPIAFASYNEKLVVTGGWSRRHGNITCWDGSRWSAMGSGLGPDAAGDPGVGLALLPFEGHLFVGGRFLEAGGRVSHYLARWDDVLTPVLVEALSVTWVDDGALLCWSVDRGSLADLAGVDVERAGEPAGPFERRTRTPLPAQGSMSFLDREADRDRSAWYRLRLLETSGEESLVGPVELRGGVLGPRFELLPIASAGSGDPVSIRFRLGETVSGVDLALYTAQGRLVRHLFRGPAASGTHLVPWDGRDRVGRPVPRGVYYARLASGGRSVARPIHRLHVP